MASLRRVAELDARTLLPGHGPLVTEPAAKIREYLDHRELRERQIVAALEAAPASIADLVRQLYADTPVGLHPMAARNVGAHLYKLEHEGRVIEDGERWRLRGGPAGP